MIPTCPKCQSKYKQVDNFCMECGKDLRIIKYKSFQKKFMSKTQK